MGAKKDIVINIMENINELIIITLTALNSEEECPSMVFDFSDDKIRQYKQEVKHLRRIRQELEYISTGLVDVLPQL